MKRSYHYSLIVILSTVPLILMWLFWDQIPERIPVHWNIRLEPDRFGDKVTHLPFIAGLGWGLQLLFWVLPVIDPKRRGPEYSQTVGRLQVIYGIFHLILFIGLINIWLGNVTTPIDWIILPVLFLLGATGNYFGKIKPNYFIGIRTPWTLESEDVWRKTHRLGGKIWVGTTVMLAVLYVFLPSKIYFYFFLPATLLMTCIPVVYAYLLSRKGEE